MENRNDKLLEIKDLRVQYTTERAVGNALNGFSMVIHKGESMGLVGETGAGKTTTALSILRLIDSPPGVMECDKLEELKAQVRFRMLKAGAHYVIDSITELPGIIEIINQR